MTMTILRLRCRWCVRERRIWPRDYSTAGESYKTHSAPARPVSVRHWIRRSFKDHSQTYRRSAFHGAVTCVLFAAELIVIIIFDFSTQFKDKNNFKKARFHSKRIGIISTSRTVPLTRWSTRHTSWWVNPSYI